MLWSEGPDGRRRWFVDGASWRVDGATGDVVDARTPLGASIAIPNWQGIAAHTAERIGRGIGQATSDPWKARALLAIAMHETGGRPLPIYGDFRGPNKTPLSVGYYQFLASTARSVGTTWGALATSPEANHRAALALADRYAAKTGNDFLTLAALWGAGRVERRAENSVWGVLSWKPRTLTEYAAAWNAARGLVRLEAPAPASSGRLLAGVGLAWLLFRFGGQQWITV